MSDSGVDGWGALCQKVVETGDRFIQQLSPIEALFDLERVLQEHIAHAPHGGRRVFTWTVFSCIGSLARQFNHASELPEDIQQRFLSQFGEALVSAGEQAQRHETSDDLITLMDELLGVYAGIRTELVEIREKKTPHAD